MRVLFLTWDGPQQSYLESLFMPIFSGLRRRQLQVEVLQLTWARDEQLAGVREAAARLGVPLSTVRIPAALRKLALPALALLGAGIAARHVRRQGCDGLFPRSLIPMGMALVAERVLPRVRLLFDADGFMADERVEFGGWSEHGASYRLMRRIEASGVRRASAVVCRTEQARNILMQRAQPVDVASKVFVAPNPKDSSLFAPQDEAQRAAVRAAHGIPSDAPWVVYVGSIGPQYCPRLMLDAFAKIRLARPAARLSCFTFHADAWQSYLRERPELAVAVASAPLAPARVPAVLAACDLGLATRQESFSQLGISPIKVAEYLLCGTPVVATRVGDLTEQLGDSAAALLVDPQSSDASQYIASWFVDQVLPDRARMRAEARELGMRWFDLTRGIDIYERALRFGLEQQAP